MKDLTEMKNLLEAEKERYSFKVWQIEARGDEVTPVEVELKNYYKGKVSALNEVINMIKERLDEAFIESLVRK